MLDAIANRRSVRFYRDQPIEESVLEEILAAGFCAPSAHNERAWHVIVVRQKARLESLAAIHKWTRFLSRVPVAVIVCFDRRQLDHFWIEDVSAFIQNVLTEATHQGLGSCWVGIRGVIEDGIDAERVVRDTCSVPPDFGVGGIVALGYAARHPGPHIESVPADRLHEEVF